MSATGRILLEFLLDPTREPEAWQRLVELLEADGVAVLDEPVGDPPFVVRLVPPADVGLPDLLGRLRSTEGVGRVEEEVMREL